MSKDGDFSETSYVLSLLSMIFAFVQPAFGFGLGLAGMILALKSSGPLSKKSLRLNVLGIILSIIVTIALVLGSSYLISKGLLPSNLA